MNKYTQRLKKEMLENKYDNNYIEQCCLYADKLINHKLPVIFDKNHLREILDLKNIFLASSYNTFYINKSEDEFREILAPSRNLKVRQKWILENILNNIKINSCVHGFLKGCSIVTNAKAHLGSQYIINIDIKNFFPSISIDRVYDIFRELGYSNIVSRELAELCCFDGYLPQGAPTSPSLSNLILRNLDKEVIEFVAKKKIIYTRYADDLTFSSQNDIEYILEKIYMFIEKNGFNVNESKTRIMGPNTPKIVTGLVLDDVVKVPKKYKRKLKQEIYYCKKFGVSNHLINSESEKRANYREYLYGKAYFIKMVQPKIGEKFLRQLDSIRWS